MKALTNFLTKSSRKKTGRKNKNPERELTVKPCLAWLERHGFSCHVIESKAVFSKAAGRYLHGQTVSGMPDIVGCAPTGVAVFIEAKAPGKIRSLSDAQREFLLTKIEHRAFAVCVDSAERLDELFAQWTQLQPSLAKQYLIGELPPVPRSQRPSK